MGTSSFKLNGITWVVEEVDSYDPMLVDRTGVLTVATTDPKTHTVYLSNKLQGAFKTKVVLHELGHCAMVSFGLLDDIHRMVYPDYWVEAEEWACNLIADFGFDIFSVAYRIVGERAWPIIPQEIERYLA